jgi:hypothetical protein
MAADETFLYYTAEQSVYRLAVGASQDRETILVLPTADVPRHQSTPDSMVLDSTSVFLGLSCGDACGSVLSAPKDGGAPTTYATGLTGNVHVAVDSSFIYWSVVIAGAISGDGMTVWRAPLAGGVPEQLASFPAVPLGGGGLAIGADSLYVHYDTIWQIPLAGGEPVNLTPNLATDGGDVVLSDSTLFWVGRQLMDKVYKLPIGGQISEVLPPGDYFSNSPSLALGNNAFYWTTDFSVMRAPFDGSAPIEVAQSEQIERMAANATYVFWSTFASDCKGWRIEQ